ncbi:hypothetical protein B0H11DRAFT_2195858 [Mycena galericulata]|nr:hypothetical protein B0H11DRAFT_2195858 [Mycena galericulata]
MPASHSLAGQSTSPASASFNANTESTTEGNKGGMKREIAWPNVRCRVWIWLTTHDGSNTRIPGNSVGIKQQTAPENNLDPWFRFCNDRVILAILMDVDDRGKGIPGVLILLMARKDAKAVHTDYYKKILDEQIGLWIAETVMAEPSSCPLESQITTRERDLPSTVACTSFSSSYFASVMSGKRSGTH